MREFSTSEKEILEFMVNEDKNIKNKFLLGYRIQSLVKDKFQKINAGAKIDFENNTLSVYSLHEQTKSGYVPHEVFVVPPEIVATITNLFQYLLNRSLIIKYKSFGYQNNVHYINLSDEFISNEENFINDVGRFVEAKFTVQFIELFKFSFILSQELIVFVENKFKTKEDLKREEDIEMFNKQLQVSINATKQAEESVRQAAKSTKVVLGVGILTALSTIIAAIITNSCAEESIKVPYYYFRPALEKQTNS